MVTSRAIVRDIFPASRTVKVFSALMLIIGVSPIVAPTVGGMVVSVFGWRYIFVTLASLGSLLFLAIFYFLAESKIPDSSISLRLKNIFRNYLDVIKNPEFFAYGMASGALSSGLFAYLGGSPFMYMQLFGLTEQQYSWIYAVNALALIGGSQMNHFLLRKRSSVRISFNAAIFQFAIGMLLILSAATLDYSKPAMYVLIFVFLLTHGILNPNTTALALNPFRESAGSASAVIGSIQMLCGALATVFISLFHNGTAIPMTAVMTGFSCLGLILLARKKMQDEKQSIAESI